MLQAGPAECGYALTISAHAQQRLIDDRLSLRPRMQSLH